MQSILDMQRAVAHASQHANYVLKNDPERMDALKNAISALEVVLDHELANLDAQCRADRVLYKATCKDSADMKRYARERVAFTMQQKRDLQVSHFDTLLSLYVMYADARA
jgi:hypothetical protein